MTKCWAGFATGKMSTNLSQIDYQNLLSTDLVHVVSTSRGAGTH